MNHDHSQQDFEAAVHEEVDGRPVVGFVDPVALLLLTGNPELGGVAHEVRPRLERLRRALARPTC